MLNGENVNRKCPMNNTAMTNIAIKKMRSVFMWQPLLFIAGFVVMMIVPGHILNYKSNHPAR